MGSAVGGQRLKIGKTLTSENIAELSSLSGFTPEQVVAWHTGFLVNMFYFLNFIFNRLIKYECIIEMMSLKDI